MRQSATFLLGLLLAVSAASAVALGQSGKMSDEEFEQLLAQARERYTGTLARERIALEEAEQARATENLQEWTDSTLSTKNRRAIQGAMASQNQEDLQEKEQADQAMYNQLLRDRGSQSRPPGDATSLESEVVKGQEIFDGALDTGQEVIQSSGTGTNFFGLGARSNKGLVVPTEDDPLSTGNSGESASLNTTRDVNATLNEMSSRGGRYRSLKEFPVPPLEGDPEKVMDDLNQALQKIRALIAKLNGQIKATEHKLDTTGQRLRDATARGNTIGAQLSQVQGQISALQMQRAMVVAQSQRNYWVQVPYTIHSPTAGITQRGYKKKWAGPGTPASWAAGIRGQLMTIDGQLASLQPRGQALNTQLQAARAAAKQAQAQFNKLKHERTQLGHILGVKKADQKKKLKAVDVEALRQDFLVEKGHIMKALAQLMAKSALGPFFWFEPLALEITWMLDYYEDAFSGLLSKLKRRLEGKRRPSNVIVTVRG